MTFKVTEAFLSINVVDMNRAMAFYAKCFGATAKWASPQWTSIEIAGVRLGLFCNVEYSGGRVGLHFAVTDLQTACTVVAQAGGKLLTTPSEIAPGVLVAEVADTEGNIFSLQEAHL